MLTWTLWLMEVAPGEEEGTFVGTFVTVMVSEANGVLEEADSLGWREWSLVGEGLEDEGVGVELVSCYC